MSVETISRVVTVETTATKVLDVVLGCFHNVTIRAVGDIEYVGTAEGTTSTGQLYEAGAYFMRNWRDYRVTKRNYNSRLQMYFIAPVQTTVEITLEYETDSCQSSWGD